MDKINELVKLFQLTFDENTGHIVPLKGDGSERRIIRLSNARRSVIGIIGNNPDENKAFVSFSRHFHNAGLRVPEIYAENLAEGIYLEEDLGDETLFKWMTGQREKNGLSDEIILMYRKALRQLPNFQIRAGRDIDYSLCYQHHEFGWASMVWDVHYFKHRFLEVFYKKSFDVGELEKDFIALIEYLISADRNYFLYRDFQSRNIMLRNGELYFVDYQSGRKGALQYDVASLLYDAKANLPESVRVGLLDYYLEQVEQFKPIDRKKFVEYFYGYVLIRIMQACGAYGYLGIVKGKKRFLKSIPFAIGNMEMLLEKDGIILQDLKTLRDIFSNLVLDQSLKEI